MIIKLKRNTLINYKKFLISFTVLFLATQPKAPKKRYTFEFLLQRADDVQSKQLPKDWPELNLKYPNICFCGRVSTLINIAIEYETHFTIFFFAFFKR